MKKFLVLLILSVFTHLAIAQINLQWEPLPSNKNSNAEIIYQTPKGNLIAKLNLKKKYIISKDKGITWNDLSIPFTNYNCNFRVDESNDVYCYFNNSNILYFLDEFNNNLSHFFSVPASAILDIAFGKGNLYIATSSSFNIYDAKKLSLNYTKTWSTQSAFFALGKNNKNYVRTSKGSTNYLSSFENDGLNFKDYGSTQKVSNSFFVLSSDNLLTTDSNGVYYSDDNGVSWKILKEITGINSVLQFKNNKIIISNSNKIYVSSDEGKTWQELNIPDFIESRKLLNSFEDELILLPNYCNNSFTKRHDIAISSDFTKTWKFQNIQLDNPFLQVLQITTQNDVLTGDCYTLDQIKENTNSTWNTLAFFDTIPIKKGYLVTLPSGKWMFNYYSDKNYLYYSYDKGKSWKIHTKLPLINNSTSSLKITQNNELVYGSVGKYYISKNEGENWTEISAPNFYFNNMSNEISKIIVLNGYIFETSDFDFKIYNPLKKEIQSILYNNNPLDVKFVPLWLGGTKVGFVAQEGFSGMNPSMYFTTDYGKTVIKKQFPSYFLAIQDLKQDANNNLIAATYDNIYISYDEGNTWESIKGNLPIANNNSFKFLEISKNQYLYIGINDNIIYKSKTPLSKNKKIEGKVFIDKNDNCLKDTDEDYVKNIKINLKSDDIDATKSSDYNGKFRFNVYDGKYQLTPKINELAYQLCKPVYDIEVLQKDDSIKLDIPLKVVKSCAGLNISLSTQVLRRCFDNIYYGTLCNDGSKDATNTTIKVKLDTFFEFKSASLPILQQVGKTLILDAGTIKAGDCINFSIKYKLTCNAALGQVHCIEAIAFSPDECSEDPRRGQSYYECQPNVGAYDPNDKASFVTGKQNTKQVKAGQKLEYLIRFQNTGTDTAFNIIVQDVISSNLDISTVEIGATSHPCELEVRNQILYFNFNNIMLPDSNKNEMLSHGFVKFSIKPKSNVTTKDLISNKAAIYFDFNDPVITNEVLLNEKTIKTHDVKTSSEQLAFSLFPNPTNSQLNLYLTENENNTSKITIYSIEGKIIQQLEFNGNLFNIDVASLNSGMYILQIKNGNKLGIERFIKIN